ncbi:MAG: ribosomal L7Ae/L30e/S12e/Gadd45 family protein [Oscillospiraceae bacterium]|nr:ribosomal L7Ae/L30e/S12e/Gadd45 family protein [Oscillospiraceae bacterium]
MAEKNNTKLLSALGLCKKAGKLTVGFDVVGEAIRRGNAKLLVLTGDISPKSAGRITAMADEHKVRHFTIDAAMDDIEKLLGKRAGILAVTDQGLAGVVARQVEEESV